MFGGMKTNFPSWSATFGDKVRIRSSVETESRGVAGLSGQVYGQTTPSVTGVDVIGELASDYAINVYFEDRQESFWFAPSLVEFIDHAWDRNHARWCREEVGSNAVR